MGQISGSDFAWERLPELFPEFADGDRWLPLLRQHHTLLRESARRVSVTAVDEAEAPFRLYGESLETLRLALRTTGDVQNRPLLVDVGSGGGFPGLVAAIVLPVWRVVLIESLRKRARLLETLASALGLENVGVVQGRAEEAGRDERIRDAADLVTARAVAELRVLAEYTGPFCRDGGIVALPKGSRLPEELDAAGVALAELNLDVVERAPMRKSVSATPWTLLLRKTGTTPLRYPRRPGVPAKRPLGGN